MSIDVDRLALPAVSVSMGDDGFVRYDAVNAAFAAFSGCDVASMIARTPHDVMPIEPAERIAAHYQRCFQTGSMQEYETELEVPTGHKWWRTTLAPVLDVEGRVVQVVGLLVDITARKQDELDLRSAAFKDPLTGICNRRRFERDLEYAVAKANDTGRPFSVIFADVDRFKSINDTHGHAVGDAVLIAVAWRLASGIRETDRLARIGGDEFAAIVTAGSMGAVAVAVDRMRRKLVGPIPSVGIDLIVGVSLGAALWQPSMTTTDVTAAADAAMYREKSARAA